jgi:protein-disulfide isomerase
VIPELIKQYVDTGKVRFVYREFPLNSIHPAAQKASEAAICAGQQDKYWEMNERLFETQQEWGQAAEPTDSFKLYAQELDLDTAAFNECLDSGAAAVEVQADLMAGQQLGVNATPYFFVGGMPIRGGLPIEALGQVIDYVAAGGETPEILPPPGDPHLLGNIETAKALAVAFVDYANPESGQHALEVLPDLVDSYIDSGQMVYILHPWSAGDGTPSEQAAIAAECAGEQGKYWEMHDEVFAGQEAWSADSEPRPQFVDYAQALALDSDVFEECLDSDWAKLRVQAGNVVGALYGVPGAPVFLFNNGSSEQGSPSLDQFESIIDSILSQ